MSEITPAEFKKRWDAGERPILLDVREADEWEICNLKEYGARLIPMSEFANRLGEVPQGQEIVVQCRSGGRSARIQQFLLAQGYTQVLNLTGGVLRWSDEVDPSMPKY